MSLKVGPDSDRWDFGDVVAVILMILVLDVEESETEATDDDEDIDSTLPEDACVDVGLGRLSLMLLVERNVAEEKGNIDELDIDTTLGFITTEED